MKFILCILIKILVYKEGEAIEVATALPPEVTTILNNIDNDTRRIINGDEVTDELPFMVYLKLAPHDPKERDYRSWLCGGAIIHEEYIMTSAACIEDATHFYVVSGTFNYADDADKFNSACIKNGAKKAIWKCIPKNYIFDGHENDNIRWMNNDIAVVKIEDGFDFTRRIRGCDFIPKPICYNNQSQTLENPGTIAQIAGWGSTERYHQYNRRSENKHHLLESLVEIISKNRCKRRWGPRYHNIIDNYMICSKDLGQSMTEVCNEKYVECSDISYDDDEVFRRTGIRVTRTEKMPTNMLMHSAYHNETRKLSGITAGSGGFCENDHGGPLVVGSGVNSILVGIISACLVKERTNQCYGPFLFTSVYKNRQFISCVIYKELEANCRRQFRSGKTHDEFTMSWKNHPDGPARNELGPGMKGPPILYEPVRTSKGKKPTASRLRTRKPFNANRKTTSMPTKDKRLKVNSPAKAKRLRVGKPANDHSETRAGKAAKVNSMKRVGKTTRANPLIGAGRQAKAYPEKKEDKTAKANPLKRTGKARLNPLTRAGKAANAKPVMRVDKAANAKPVMRADKSDKINPIEEGMSATTNQFAADKPANARPLMRSGKLANATIVNKKNDNGDS